MWFVVSSENAARKKPSWQTTIQMYLETSLKTNKSFMIWVTSFDLIRRFTSSIQIPLVDIRVHQLATFLLTTVYSKLLCAAYQAWHFGFPDAIIHSAILEMLEHAVWTCELGPVNMEVTVLLCLLRTGLLKIDEFDTHVCGYLVVNVDWTDQRHRPRETNAI